MPKEKMSKGKQNPRMLKRWLPVAIMALFMAVAYLYDLPSYLSLESFHDHKEAFQGYVRTHPLLSGIAFIALYTACVALSLPVATLLTLSGGFLFGLWLGALYVVIGATIGATILFLIAKSSLGQTLREKAGNLYARIEQNMADNATGYLLFMRLVPIFPFVLVNIIPALFNVRLSTFILTTFFGILPGSIVYVNLGRQLGEIEHLSDLASAQTFMAFALLGLFALIPTLYKQYKSAKNPKITTLCLAALTLVSPLSAHASAYDTFLENYDALLAQYVAPMQKNAIPYMGVSYDAWAKDERHALGLTLLKKTDPVQFKSNNEKMAFWINTYNFLTIDLIVRKGEKNSIKNLGSLFQNPWNRYSWTINGMPYTLDQIEHKILRPMGDPRVHFAINCASVSCPDLRAQAYRAEKLDAQLAEQLNATLEHKGKGFAEEENAIKISLIFKWFSKDFNAGNVKGWLAEHLTFDTQKPIEYMGYDWSLNKGK